MTTFLAYLFGAVVLLWYAGCLWLGQYQSSERWKQEAREDKEMQQNQFFAHKTQFEKLRQMILKEQRFNSINMGAAYQDCSPYMDLMKLSNVTSIAKSMASDSDFIRPSNRNAIFNRRGFPVGYHMTIITETNSENVCVSFEVKRPTGRATFRIDYFQSPSYKYKRNGTPCIFEKLEGNWYLESRNFNISPKASR